MTAFRLWVGRAAAARCALVHDTMMDVIKVTKVGASAAILDVSAADRPLGGGCTMEENREIINGDFAFDCTPPDLQP